MTQNIISQNIIIQLFDQLREIKLLSIQGTHLRVVIKLQRLIQKPVDQRCFCQMKIVKHDRIIVEGVDDPLAYIKICQFKIVRFQIAQLPKILCRTLPAAHLRCTVVKTAQGIQAPDIRRELSMLLKKMRQYLHHAAHRKIILIPLVVCLYDLIQKFLRQLIIEAVLLLDERPDIKIQQRLILDIQIAHDPGLSAQILHPRFLIFCIENFTDSLLLYFQISFILFVKMNNIIPCNHRDVCSDLLFL